MAIAALLKLKSDKNVLRVAAAALLTVSLLSVCVYGAGPQQIDLELDLEADTVEISENASEIKDNSMSVSAETERIISGMTTEEKIYQLFIVTPEALTGYGTVTAAGESTREAVNEKPVGGIIYMGQNLSDSGQIKEMLSNTQKYSLERTGLPMLLCVDEEGGTVRRINGKGITDDPEIPSMREVGTSGDPSYAEELGEMIGKSLSQLGFNVDFAPVADVLTNENNTVVRDRSFGSDPQLVADMVKSLVRGLHKYQVGATLKHFPGHGSTSEDTHDGYAYSNRTVDELLACDLVPFQAGIDEGAELVMAGHISFPQVTGDETPASLSRVCITDLLRGIMGYDGVVITDALNMGAVADHYGSGEAAVLAIEAGCDMILMPADFESAFYGVLQAVRSGRVTEERIEESVRRIVELKERLG